MESYLHSVFNERDAYREENNIEICLFLPIINIHQRNISVLSNYDYLEFLRNLADGICNLMWGPVPLMLLTEVLSKLPRCPSWSTQQLYAFR